MQTNSTMTAHAASHVYFDLNAMWVSTCVLAIAYAVIMLEKVNRAIVRLIGARADENRSAQLAR